MSRLTAFGDFRMDVPSGAVPNHSAVNKFGRNPSIAAKANGN